MMETLAFVSLPQNLEDALRKSKSSQNGRYELFTVTFSKSSFRLTQCRKCVLCCYRGKLAKCTTDIEVKITQVISAVPDNFWKIERSSDRSASYRTKPAKCTTRMEITIKLVT